MKKIFILLLLITGTGYSLTLEEAQTKALQNNLELKKHHLEYQISKTKEKEEFQLWYPQLFFDADYTSFKDTMYVKVPLGLTPLPSLQFKQIDKDFLQVKVGLNYYLFTGFIRPNKIKIAQLRVENKKFLTTEKAQEILQNVSLAYTNALIANQMVKVYQEEEKALKALQKKAEKFLEKGLTTKVDLLQVGVQLEKVKLNKEEARQKKKNAKLFLLYLIGENLDNVDNLKPIKVKPIHLPPLEVLEKKALTQRKLLNVAKNAIKESNYIYEIAKGQFLPKIYLQGGYSYTDQNPYISPKDNLFLTVGSTLQFQGVKPYYQMLQAKLGKKKAKISFEDLKRQIRLKVQTLYNQFKTRQKQLELAKIQLKEAKTYYEMAKKQYENQLISMTDLLIAHSKYFAAKSRLVITKYQLLKTYFKIKREIGGLSIEK